MSWTEAHCRGCGAKILWGRTAKNNKAIPLDPNPEQRAIQVGQGEHGEPIVEIRGGYMPHHATCPNRDEFRKPKEPC